MCIATRLTWWRRSSNFGQSLLTCRPLTPCPSPKGRGGEGAGADGRIHAKLIVSSCIVNKDFNMSSIAIIGPDGAGKTTITRMLQASSSLPLKYLYMGINIEASNFALLTSRLIEHLKRY